MSFRFILTSQVIASLSALFINIYFARSLGVSRFGEYALLTGIAFFLATINGAGVQQALLSQRYDRAKFFFNSARLLNLLSIILLSIVSLLIAFLCGFEKIFIVLAIFIAFSLRDFGKKELVARRQYKRVLVVESFTCFFLYAVAFISFELLGVKNPELVFIISLTLSSLTLLSVIVPKLHFVSKREMGQIIRFVKWVLPAILLSMVGVPALPIVLGVVLGADSVGVYRALQNILGISNMVNQIYDMWLQPKSRDMNSQSAINYVQMINLGLFFIIGFCVFVYGGVFFEVVYGLSFVESPQFSVSLVLAAYALFAMSVPLTIERIRAKIFGQPAYLFKSSIFYCLLCLLSYCSFIFFHSYGGVIALLALCSSLTSLYLFVLVKNGRSQ